MTKKNHFSLFIILASCLIILGFGQVSSTLAQNSEGSVNIFQIDTSKFPTISFFLEAKDSNGLAIQDLTESEISVIEGNTTRKEINTLVKVEPGIQVIISYNLGPALSNSASSGGTRYQAVNETIATWVESQPANNPDDFSLATNTGLQSIRVTDTQEFSELLRNYDPQLGTNQPNLTSLLQSLDLATDPNRNELMKRVILYVTPQLNVTNVSVISGLIDRAVQQNVIIFVWLVGPANVETTNPSVVDPLKEISEKTGGQFFVYSGEGVLPDPEDYLQPLRTIYQASYHSSIIEKGNHRVSASISHGDNTIVSNQVVFPLNILPPNIIVIDPKFSLDRTWQAIPSNPEESVLIPDHETIQFMIEFPDGFQREIVATRLYENGDLVIQKTTPPFDNFLWDLSQYQNSQIAELVLEVEDNLGIISQSIPLDVQINVAEKPLTFWQSLLKLQLTTDRWIILGSVLTTGVVLVLAIVMAGKRRNFWRQHSAARERRTDPLTQPVPIRQEISRLGNVVPGTYPQVKGQEVGAWLVPLNDGYEALRTKAIPLTRPELIIGKDSQQSGLVIPSPAMSDVHARLTRDQAGDFWLADNNSAVVIMVQCAPRSTLGCRLRHGDLVHFAKNLYRFELTNPPPDREAQLITYNNDI
jgi:hypothetical protein